MSHHQYNRYASGNPTSTQRQYEHSSMQPERDHRWGSSLGPGSSYSSLGSSTARVEQSDRGIPSLLQTRSYRPEQGTTAMDDIDERSMDMHRRRAREEVKGFGQHQPMDPRARFTSAQREDNCSPDTGMMSYSQSSLSASVQHRCSDVNSDSSSWGSSYRRPASDDAEFYSSTAFQYPSTGDNRHNDRSAREDEVHSVASLKDYNYNITEQSSASIPESSIPKYTPQSAADILLYFGLEKEDLEELKSYPEDQLTPANLPFILRQIRIKKGKTPAAGSQKTLYPDPRATRSGSGLDSNSLGTSTAAGVSHKGTSSSGLQQSQVIDYGHVSRYTGSIVDDGARTSDSRSNDRGIMSLMDSFTHSRNQEGPLQKDGTLMKSASLGASHYQETSVTGQSSSYRSVLNSAIPPVRQLQPSQDGFSPYSVKKDADVGILKTESSKPAPLKEPEADCQPTKTIQPTFKSSSKGHVRSTSVTGVVLFDSKNKDGKTSKKTQDQVPTGAEQFKQQQVQLQQQPQVQLQQQPQVQRQFQQQVQVQLQQQPQRQLQPQAQRQPQAQLQPQAQQQPQAQLQPQAQRQPQAQLQPQAQRQPQAQPQQQVQFQQQPPAQRQFQQQPVGQQSKQKLPLLLQQQPKEQQLNQPAYQPGQPTWLPGFASARSASHSPGLGALPALGNLATVPQGRPPVNAAPVLPQLMNFGPLKFTTAATKGSSAVQSSAQLPTPAMMYDYAATSPKTFPHTCSLCNTECTRMKDWISHQNTSLHLENCKYLRTRYPNWDGEITCNQRDADKDSKPSTSQHRQQQKKLESRSRSRSRSDSRSRRHGSESRREKRRSRSYSPYTPRYTRRSRSNSSERSSPRKRDDGRHSPKRTQSSSKRSHERKWSSRRSEERSPSRRSRERKRSSRSEDRSPPRRSREQRQSPRGSEDGSPSRRSRDRRRPPRKGEEGLSSRRRHERQSSTEESSPSRVLSTAERLAKKLLEKSDVQSLTQQSKLEAVVKTLAPALLAELVKINPAPSTSRAKKDAVSESDNSSPARIVMLDGIDQTLSHSDVRAAVEKFGKTESVVLHRFTEQAVVYFEKEEDAEKLKMAKKFEVKGFEIVVCRYKGARSAEKKTPAEEKSSVSAVSGGKTTTRAKVQTTAVTNQNTQNKSKALISKAKQTGKAGKPGTLRPKAAKKEAVVNQKTPAQSSNGNKESRSGQFQQKSETFKKESVVAGKDTPPYPSQSLVKAGPASRKGKDIAAETIVSSISATSDNQPQTRDHKQKCLPDKSETTHRDSVMKTKPPEVDKSTKKKTKKKPSSKREELTATSVKDEEASKDASEPKQLGESGNKAVQPDGIKSCADIKEENVTTEVAVSEKTDDKYKESQPVASTAETPSTKNEIMTTEAIQTSATYSTADTPLTVGEVIQKHLDIKQIVCLKWSTCQSQRFFQFGLKPVLITGLPEYYDGCYKVEDVVQLLLPFGFQNKSDNIYIVPQIRMAFVKMPTMESVHNLITKAKGEEKMTIKCAKISFHVLGFENPASPCEFYKLLMRLMNFHVADDGSNIIYIDNISLSESKSLRESLKKIGSVKNFLPLLNKLFIEFDSPYDADRLGVWYSLLKKSPDHIIHRKKIQPSSSTSLSPKLPEQALPDRTESVTWATVPSMHSGVPQGTTAPFWIPLKTSPYIFPTIAPWFNIPEFLTVTGTDSIKAASSRGSTLPIIMLTGLPDSVYRHQNVVNLVWRYFHKPDLQTFYYNIIVLPLQGRAFVFFPDWTACCSFVKDHISQPVSIRGKELGVHFVMQHMSLELSEEKLYKTAMKLSNVGVSETESLEERLLCVEINEAAAYVPQIVLEVVASIAPFVSFLVLGNRICIEMVHPSCVTQVLEVYKSQSDLLNQKQIFWGKVQRVESLNSFKQRLQDHGNLIMSLEKGIIKLEVPSQPEDPKTCETSENVPDVAAKDEEKPGVEMIMDFSATPETEDGTKERISEESLHSTADETAKEAAPMYEIKSEEPLFDEMKVRTESASQLKPKREIEMVKEENADQKEQDDDMDLKEFNMDDFVTVDEVGADVEDTPVECEISTSTSSTSTTKRTDSARVKEEKHVESAVAKSDHKVGAECKEAEKLPVHKQEEQEDGDNYQIIDSFEEQTDEKMDKQGSSSTQPTEPGVGVDIEGKIHPEEKVGMPVHESAPGEPAASSLENIQVQERPSLLKQLSDSNEILVVEKSEDSAFMERSKDMEGPGRSSSRKDQLTQDSKAQKIEEIKQNTFEILNTIDKETAPQDDQLEKQFSTQDEGCLDSQPVTAESESDKDRTGRKRKRTPSRRSGESSQKMDLTSTISIGESATKQRTRKKYESRGKTDTSAGVSEKDKLQEAAEEVVLEDGAQDGKPGGIRSTRGKKDDKLSLNLTETAGTALIHAETPYKVLDSPAEETPDDEAKVTTSARGKRGSSTKKAALNAPARKRATEELSETQLPDQERATNTSEVTGEECEEDAAYQILDSVGDEVLEESPAPTRQRKRGRPKKTAKARKGKQPLKDDAAEKVTEGEEEEVYQVIDSVEEDAADDQLVAGLPEGPGRETTSKTGDEQIADGSSVPGSTRNQEEEEPEPLYQMVGSLTTEAVSAASKDDSKCTAAAHASTGVPNVPRADETVSDLEVREDSAAAEGSGTSSNQSPSKMESGQEDKPETESQNEPPNPEEAPLDKLVNLDEVSEEEENYPDDTAEEEEPRTRRAGSKKKQEAKPSERPRTQRSRRSNDRGGDRSRRITEKERGKQNEHSVEEDTKELLTLDEVGADEPEEERAAESRDKDEIGEAEPQSLITLDEVGDEGEDKVAENNSPRTHPLSEEDQSVDFLNPETLVTLDEAGEEEPEEDHRQKHAGKRKADTETDEVGEEEEEKIAPRTRGRPRKRTKKTPVRRSVRGKNTTTIDAEEKEAEEKEAASVAPPTFLEKAESVLSTDGQEELQRSEVKSGSAEQQSGDQTQEERLDEEKSREDVKAVSKRRTKLAGPGAKRVCKQSTGVNTAFDFPVSKPKSPVGQEFVVPVSGYFCHLCSLFYRNENTAMELHCSSQKHYDNLQKHCEKIKQKQSGSTTEKSRGPPASE